MRSNTQRAVGFVARTGALLAIVTLGPGVDAPALAAARAQLPAQASLPSYLRDRGPGVPTSMFGSYVRRGELLVYPFAEWYVDSNLEYKPEELGYAGGEDRRARYTAAEQLIFVSYGFTEDLAVEMEGAYITAKLEKAADDVSARPSEVKETGIGDVEGQIRYRFLHEDEKRPEGFAFFETVFPLQKHRRLIGTRDWEFAAGAGFTKGMASGTWTVRFAAEYSRDEGKVDAGEYAVEYLRRVSKPIGVVAVFEGSQLDEVSLITELQWHFSPRAVLKANNGFGLTENATDIAPEVGVMFSF